MKLTSSVLVAIAIATTFSPRASEALPKLNLQKTQSHQTLNASLTKQSQTSSVYSVPQNAILLEAVKNEDLDLAKLALSRNADPNTLDKNEEEALNGRAILQIAAENNSLEIAKLLIAYGANVNGNPKYTYIGGTPLSAAAAMGHLEIVKLLVNKGAKLDLAADGGYTALDEAIAENRSEVVQFLLERSMNPNYYVEGYTPLYDAASRGYTNIVRLLIKHGADVNFGNSFAKPLAIAIKKSHLEIIDILKKAGARSATL